MSPKDSAGEIYALKTIRLEAVVVSSQRAEYPLNKEYTLNFQGLHMKMQGIFLNLIKGYWALWVQFRPVGFVRFGILSSLESASSKSDGRVKE